MGLESRGAGARGGDSYFLKRREEKYEMQIGAAAFLRNEIERNLPRFEFRKGHPYTYITTIYFDTEKLDFYQKAKICFDDNTKIRVKEYYYQNNSFPHPGLTGRAAGPWLTFDTCFVEIKQRIRGIVWKRRFEVPKRLFGRLVRGEDVWDELVASRSGIEFDGMFDTYREFRTFLQHFNLVEKSIINYRRSVYQQDEHELRITFDDEIAVFAPKPGLYESVSSLARDFLGPPREIFQKVILEIKCQDGFPDWLTALLLTHRPKKISKFTSSLRVLTNELPCHESDDGGKTNILVEDASGEETGDTTQASRLDL
jgi:hypothetical protein